MAAALVGASWVLTACSETSREPRVADLAGVWHITDDRGDGWERTATLTLQGDGTWTMLIRSPNIPKTAYDEGRGEGQWRLSRRKDRLVLELLPGTVTSASDWSPNDPFWYVAEDGRGGWVLQAVGARRPREYRKSESWRPDESGPT